MRLGKLALALAAGAALFAGRAMAADEAPNKGALSFSGGVDWTTDYFFRGYLQEDDGLILQPYGQMNIKVIENDSFTLTPFVGIWNSFHEEETLSDGSSPDWWYEADLFAGFNLGMGDFTATFIYTAYTYPNGAFDTIHELGAKLAYNDSKLWGGNFALSPFIAAYFEVDDQNAGATDDAYLEVGIAPAFTWNISQNMPLTISFPALLGMSLEDYYFDDGGDDEFVGYGQVGIQGSLPLPLSAKYGSWALVGSVNYIHLFADSAEAANGGDDDEVFVKVGITFSY